MIRPLATVLLGLLLAAPLRAGLSGRGRPPRPAPPPAAGPAEPGPRVTLRVALSADWIRVEVETPEPVAGLRFPLALGDGERRGWTLPTDEGHPPARWERRDGADQLVVPSPRRRFRFAVPVPVEDAPLLWRRPGARLLDVEVLRPIPLGRDDAGLELELTAPPRSHLLGAGTLARGTLRVSGEAAEVLRSTPILISDVEPVDFQDFHMLVAADLPRWIQDMTHVFLPRVMESFSRLTGGPLWWKPVLLLSHRDSDDAEAYEVHAEGQGALLELVTEGGSWDLESPEGTVDWLWLACHHIFHLWNQEAYTSALPDEEAFLVEGAAEYAMLLALAELELVSGEEWTGMVRDKAVRCAEGADRPLVAMEPDLASDCGTTLWLVADSWVRHGSKEAHGAAALFTGLLERAGEDDARYTRYDLLETVRSLTDGPEPARALTRWIEVGLGPHPREALEGLLRQAGYPLDLRAAP